MPKLIITQMKNGVISAAVGLLFFAIATLAVSYLTYNETISFEKTKTVMMIALFVSCTISGVLSSKGVRTGKWRCAVGTGCIILLFIVLLTAACCETLFNAKTIINTAIIAAGTSLGCMFCAKSTKKKRRKPAKYNS